MITRRGLNAIHSLLDWREPAADAFDQGLEAGIDTPCLPQTHNIREPRGWNNHPANQFHWVYGDLVLPADDETDQVAIYEKDGIIYLVGEVDGDGLRVVKLKK